MKLRAVAAAGIAAVFWLSCMGFVPSSGAQLLPDVAAAAPLPLLTVGTLSGISTLNPNTTQGCATDFCGLFMERLLKFGPDQHLEPELATSVSQPGPLTYVYHLRQGVKFWDGHEMTSADVVYSLDYQESGPQTSTYYTNVKSITADGPFAVVVTLKAANAGWPYTVAYEGVIFEKSYAEAHKANLGEPGVLIQATGPWEVDSFDPTSGLELSANPSWWGGNVPVQHISFKFFSSETSEALAMRAGEIDVAFPSDGQTFQTTSGAEIIKWQQNQLGYFGMNTKLAPWSDLHVRLAVAYALNRANIIVANGGAGSAIPDYTFIPPSEMRTIGTDAQVNALLSSIPEHSYNLATAKQQMAESAYPHGFTATLDVTDYGSFINICQVIAAELRPIGITLKLDVDPLAKWVAITYGPKTYGALFTTIHESSPDPSGFPAYLLGSENIPSGGLNWADYDPASVDNLLSAGVATINPGKRFDIYTQVLAAVARDVPYVPLYQTDYYVALASGSKFTITPFNVDTFEVAWALNIRPTA